MPRQKSDHVDSAAALAQRLRDARRQAGLSQRALAGGICTPAYISRLEKGERVPSLQLLRRLAQRLGADADELASGVRGGRVDPLLDAELAMRLGEREEAERSFREAAKTDDPGLRRRALWGLGQLAFDRGDQREAITLLEQTDVLACAETLGRAYAQVGELDSAIGLFEDALDAAGKRGDTVESLRFEVLLANALIDAGRYDGAAELLEDAVARAGDSGDPIELARVWWSESRLHAGQGEADTAARYARRALDVLTLTEHTTYAARAHQLLAHIELDRGRTAEAVALLETGYPLIDRSGNRYEQAMFRVEQARALARLGDGERATALAGQAAELAAAATPSEASRAYAVAADVFAELGDRTRAIELYELAEENRPADSRVGGEVAARHAEILEQEGRKDDALAVLKRAIYPSEVVRTSDGKGPRGSKLTGSE